MSTAEIKEYVDLEALWGPEPRPDHTMLPDSDGVPAENLQEKPQVATLTDSILPVLDRIHPDGRFAVAGNSGTYWRRTDPPVRGAIAPDWFYVPGVPRLLGGKLRRSYVMWKEGMAPLIALEFASTGGDVERDRTPLEGKFWIYERVVRPRYYGIFDFDAETLEVYTLVDDRFELMEPNARGRYPIAELGVELGLWKGVVERYDVVWLRWFDEAGSLLVNGREAEAAQAARAERLREQLRNLGVDPDA